ncbi:APC family permease [Rhodococcoides fascians]|uniref:Putrescine importer PuuP n=1 Tax=Rhodococcoides fascians TaxID=1828 RepID=A0A143QM72_RHOFA|nr:APC family permease [Rhodococcus fascians]AMY24263.1 Putrescine importer PuuP [Rhodococcus fascians]KMJ48578.1 amino acid transporter [Rhodococcus fascians]OZC42753.1 APC family permease [Rhodococcus fascians]
MSDTRDGKLKGSIGVVGIVFLVIAAAAPLTAIGGALPIMIATGNGAGAPMAYIVAAVVLLVFSVGYAAMSSHMTDTGAFYAYVGKGLGENVGLGAAGLALLTYTAIQAGIYGLAASTLQGLVVSYGGPDLPWWLWALVLIGIVSVLGYRSIDLGAKVLGVLLVLEIGIVLALSMAVFAQGGADGIDVQSFTPDAFLSGSPGIALMFAIASFIGFEATAIYGEEAKDPKRTVPIATYAAVIVIGAVYAVSSWAVVLAFGSNSVADAAAADPAGLTFAAAAQFLGATWSDIIQIMLVTSLFAALLAFHNAISRYVFALARRGAAPKALARTHARHGSPHVGSIFQTLSAVLVVGVFALAGADPILQLFTWMSGLATVSILVLMILTGVAIYTFFARTRVDSRTWHTKIAPVLGTLGLLVVLGLVLDNFTLLIGGSSTIAAILLLIVVGFFVAGLLRGISTRRSRSTEASRAIEHEPGELAQ